MSAFGRLKTYKPENPSGWHYLLDEPSPEMDPNPNLNGWTSIWSPFQILKTTAVLQTFFLKISRTPYYSSSWDVPILLYESLKTLKWPKNKSENLNRGCRTSKNDFCENSADHQFFRRRCANFVPIFGRLKTYKPKNPSGWRYLLDEPSPEMDSNPNLNV